MGDFPKDPPIEFERQVSSHEGENTRDVPYLLSENAVRLAQNMIINEPGRRKMRPGAQAFGAPASEPGGAGVYTLANSQQRFVGVWGDLLYDSSGNGGWGQIASGQSGQLIEGKQHMFVQGRSALGRALYICQAERGTSGGSDQSELIQYDIDTDSSTRASGIQPRCVEFFQNRVWAGGLQGASNFQTDLYWAEVGGGLQFSDGNNLLIEPGVGGEVTALLQTREETPRLLIFKESAIAVLDPRWGSSSALIPTAADALDVINSSVKLLTRGAGCIATKTCIWVPGAEGADVFFLAADGVRSLSRAENDVIAGAGLPISWNAKDIFDRVTWAHAHKAVAVVYDNAYHIALPLDGATQNTHVARYDLFNKAWSLHTWGGKDWFTAELAAQQRLYFQNNTAVNDSVSTGLAGDAVYQLFRAYSGSLDPGGTNIIMTEESRSFMFREPFRKKRWSHFTMGVGSAETQWLEIAYRVDLGPWRILTSEPVDGADGTIVLGEDALPWDNTQDLVRKKQFSLLDAAPGFAIDMRISTITQESAAIGQPIIYITEVAGHKMEDRFESEA
jgi:hypothetical protein